jgi:hypothetical protein
MPEEYQEVLVMEKKNNVIFFTVFILFCWSGYALSLPSFPGAQGSAAEATGGRNASATVYKVTNLNNSGAGSFRAACEASGYRYVVFATSGWIHLTSSLEITNPNITIAGQTSPGGVGVYGGTVRVSASNVVITHMRFAAGSLAGQGTDSFEVWGPNTDNIMVDHSSIRWGCDECGETAYDPVKVTFSWCVIGPGINGCASESNHNLGFLVWGGDSSYVTFHHCYFTHNRYRNPEVNGGGNDGNIDQPHVDIINNVGFDTYGGYTGFHSYAGEMYANVVHNYFKKASQNNSDAREGILFNGASSSGDASIYLVGNNGAWRTSWDDSRTGYQDWDALKTEWNGSTPNTSWRRLTRNAFPGVAVTVTNMTSTYASDVVADSGATKPVIDSLDALYKTHYANGTHVFYEYTSADAIGDYPSLSGGSAPTDSDNDGMADSWETSTFGSTSATANADADSDGYSNLEEYLFYLGGYSASDTPVALPGAPHLNIVQ